MLLRYSLHINNKLIGYARNGDMASKWVMSTRSKCDLSTGIRIYLEDLENRIEADPNDYLMIDGIWVIKK